MKRLAKVLEFLAGYTELLYVWIAAGAWEDFTKTHLSAATVMSLFGVTFLKLSVRNWYRWKPRLEAGEVAARKTPEPRIFADDPESFIAQLRNPKLLTDMQVVRYIGKWIMLGGVVEFAGGTTLTLILERGQRVNIRFTREEPLRSVCRGDSVTAISQLARSFSEPWLSLEKGELVRISQESRPLARLS